MKKIKVSDIFSVKTLQQEPVLQQIFLCKQFKSHPITPILSIRANKGLLHNHFRFQEAGIIEYNQINYYVSEKQTSKICLQLSFFLNNIPEKILT